MGPDFQGISLVVAKNSFEFSWIIIFRLELTKKNHEASVARYERIHQRMKEIKEGKRAGVFDELLREQEKKK